MSIGVDIASVINELGTTATILRTPTNLTEKILYEINEISTSPFTREYFLNASFIYNSVIVSGDVIQFSGITCLVSSKTPDNFEDSTVENLAVLYKCNLPSTAKILIPGQTQNATTYEITPTWTVRKSLAYGLLYQDTRGTLKNEDSPTGKDPVFQLVCLVPDSYGVVQDDRLLVTSTEYYRVQDIEKYQYPGIHVLSLVEDNRLVYTP